MLPIEKTIVDQVDWLFRLERFHDAEELLRKWIMVNPSASVVLQALLSQAISRQPGRYREAIDEAYQAITLDPDSPSGYYVLALIIKDGDPQGALDALASALRCAPNRPVYFALQARIYLQMKQIKQALESIEMARRLDPENADWIQIQAVILLNSGKARQARDVIDAGLRRAPENGDVHNALGWTLMRLGESDLARLHFSEALRINPKLNNARLGLSHALKARYPFFIWMYRYYLWHRELAPWKRWLAITLSVIVFWYLVPMLLLVPLAIFNIHFLWVAVPLALLLAMFATFPPLSLLFFTLLLRFDRYGQLSLTKVEIWTIDAILVNGICSFIGIVLGLVELLTSQNGLNALALFLVSLLIGNIIVFWKLKPSTRQI